MKISEACQLAGVTPATLKYYIREALVPEGERTSANQTSYTLAHVQRVKLVRALLDTGGLTIASARDVLRVLDAEDLPLASAFAAAQAAIGNPATAQREPSAASRERVAALIAANSWISTPTNPGFDLAAHALDGLATIEFAPTEEFLQWYSEGATSAARADLSALASRDRPDLITELMVVGTVMGDALAAGLRRLAQQHETARVFPYPTPNPKDES